MQPFPHIVGGQEVWFLEPERFVVDVDVLLDNLSRECRYGNSYRVTVLKHLALGIRLIEAENGTPLQKKAFAGHDLHEGIVLDIPAPLKPLLGDGYTTIEERWYAHVHRSVGLPCPLPPDLYDYVHRIDNLAASVEMFVAGHPSAALQRARYNTTLAIGHINVYLRLPDSDADLARIVRDALNIETP